MAGGKSLTGASSNDPGTMSTEAAILGTLLSEEYSALPPVLGRLLRFAPQSFADDRLGLIAVTIRELWQRGARVRVASVLGELNGQLEALGGSVALEIELTRLAVGGLPLSVAEQEAAALWEAYLARRGAQVMEEYQQALALARGKGVTPEEEAFLRRMLVNSLQEVDRLTTLVRSWSDLVNPGTRILARPPEPLVEIVEGILPECCKLVIGSGAKTCKTWLAMHLGLCIASGLPFWGHPCQRRRVLYVNLELRPSTFERRLHSLSATLGLEGKADDFLHLPLRGALAGLLVHEIVNRLLEVIKTQQIAVLFLDPIYKVNVEGDENSSRDQTRLFNELDRITTEGRCTMIMNDHFSKGNQSEKDPLDAIRGSSAKGGDVDCALVLRKHEEDHCFRVDVIHRELPPLDPFCIGWNFPLFELRPELEVEEMKQVGRKPTTDYLELLRVIGHTTEENAVSISHWSELSGKPRMTVSRAAEKIRSFGWTQTIGDGTHAKRFCTELGRSVLRRSEG